MKTFQALLCLCLPFYFFAQNDNYCPCQETQSNYEALFEWSVQLHEEWKPVNLPPEFYTPPPAVMQEPVIVYVLVPTDQSEKIPEELAEPQIDESRINIAPEKVNNTTSNSSSFARSKIRKKNKLFKRKVKKRKKAKKYKGKCPAF